MPGAPESGRSQDLGDAGPSQPAGPEPDTAHRRPAFDPAETSERSPADVMDNRPNSDMRLPLPTRVAAGALAVLLGLGATVVLGFILSDSVSPPSRRAARLDEATRDRMGDSSALRIDVLFEQAGWPPPRLSPDVPQLREVSTPEAWTPTETADSTANPSAGSTRAATGVVRDFYRLLESDPARALALVSAGLTDHQRALIARGWRALSSVRPHEIVPVGNGEVLATIAARDGTGTSIALRYSFSITHGSDPRISRVRLRAARLQRSAEHD